MRRDYVVAGTYEPGVKGVLRNEWREWVSNNELPYVIWRGIRHVATHPRTWPGIAASYGLVKLGVPFWLAWLPMTAWPIWKADKSRWKVLGSALQSRSVTQGWNTLRNWWRVRSGWATGAIAANFAQPGRGGAVPRLHSWEVTNAGISAWVANGQFGWTADRLAAEAQTLGSGIDKCRSVIVTPGQYLGDARIDFVFADPLRVEIPITRLPVPPTSSDPQRRKLCIGFNGRGDPMFIDRHLSLLLIGLPNAGKTTQIGTLVTSQLQSGEPFELWVVDPNEGVDLDEFGHGSPIVREYAYDRESIRRLVLNLYTAMKERMRAMKGNQKIHLPTPAAPRWYLVIDELVLFADALKGKDPIYAGKKKIGEHDYEAMFRKIMASQRRTSLSTWGNTQSPFDWAMGQGISQLWPQKIIFRCSAKWITAAVFGSGAEDLGAKASKIEKKYPGIYYSLNQDETELERGRGPYMARPILKMVAEGMLPYGVATTEEQQAERDNRPQVIYRWDHPDKSINVGHGEPGLLYVGISISSFDRAKQHWSNTEKEIFMDPGVVNTVLAKLTPDGLVHRYIDGQEVTEPFRTPLGNGHTVVLEAEAQEKVLIQQLGPLKNIAHNGARPREKKAITV